MLQTLSKKLSICLIGILILVTCVSCKTGTSYLVRDYFNDLSISYGIGTNEDYIDNYNILLSWNIVDEDDIGLADKKLRYDLLVKTICRVLNVDENQEELIKLKILDSNIKLNNYVDKEDAFRYLNKLKEIVNNQEFPTYYDYDFSKDYKEDTNDLNIGDVYFDEESQSYKKIVDIDNNEFVTREATLDEIYENYEISSSFELDFSKSEIIPYFEEENSSYVNNKFNLLASNENHVFNADGFRVSYSFNASSASIHISKKVDMMTIYDDLSISKVKANFKYKQEDNDLKNAYFSLNMNTTNKLGATSGKYGKYYLDLKDLDSDSFMSKVNSMFKKGQDEIEAIIPICTIRTPIPNIPFASIDLQLIVKVFVNGKVELVLYNSHNIGFETIDGKFRCFYEHDDDVDAIARASASAALGLNCSLDSGKIKLCDLELDAGLRSELKTTLHLYDSDFNETAINSDMSYDAMEELSKENQNVKVCGDVSFYWLTDLIVNTYRTKMNKMGFTKTFHIFDEDNQVFNNLHHIENGQFVKKCTRKSKPFISVNSLGVTSLDKIVLNSYAEVLDINEIYEIEIKSLPNGYKKTDLIYDSSNPSVASVSNGKVIGLQAGTSQIEVKSKDDKYSAYVNILVSTG